MLAPSAGLLCIRHLLLAFLFTAAVVSRITIASGPHTLTVTVSGSGTVSRNPNFPQYPNGSVVTLTATPDSRNLFSHWTGDLTGSGNPANIEMTNSKTVVAHFVPIPEYTVTTSVSGQGAITLTPSGGTYPSNSTVTASAAAAQGWVFTSWSGDTQGTSNPIQLIVDRNKSITANFAESVKITDPPNDVSTNSGSSVIFEVAASGTPPLRYQWSHEGQPIAGAIAATLMIPNVQLTNEGTYSVIVSNAYSSATAAAILRLTDFECTGANVVTEPTEQALRNAVAIGGHVQLCFNGTITLTQAITITKDVALDAGPRSVTISGGDATRLFIVATNRTLALTNVTLSNGRHVGASNRQGGDPGLGGAILNEGGTLIITGTTLINNQAIGGNHTGEPELGDPSVQAGQGAGGAIFNQHGIVSVASSTFSNNAAWGGRGYSSVRIGAGGDSFGGAIASIGGTLSIVSSALQSNKCIATPGSSGTIIATSSGGAIFMNNSASTISNSLFHANILSNVLSSFDNYITPPASGRGGALRVLRGTTLITLSRFSNNRAEGASSVRDGPGSVGFGGAIYSEGGINLVDCNLTENLARSGSGGRFSSGAEARGGAWYNLGNASVSRSTFSLNLSQGGHPGQGEFGQGAGKAGDALGGAIFNLGNLSLTNCTIAMNIAYCGAIQLPPGGDGPFSLAGLAAGAGIYNGTNASVFSGNVTFASNRLDHTSIPAATNAIFLGANLLNSTNSTATLRNTILAYPNGTNANAHGILTDGGHNISSDGSANFNSGTSFNFTDPRLESLSDNGGPSLTMALKAGSPAIDFGATDGAPSTDQRRVARPYGAGIDIGAYEWTQQTAPTLSLSLTSEHDLRLTFQAAAETSYEIQTSTNLADWVTIETIPATPNAALVTRQYEPSSDRTFYTVSHTPLAQSIK